MNHTKESLFAMSDFEVNKVLAELLGKKIEQHSIVGLGLQWCVVDENDGLHRIKDYCHNPSDVMPLVFENRISLIENDVGYTAYHNFSIFEDINYRIEHGAYFGDTNPLRAAACCLILFLQV